MQLNTKKEKAIDYLMLIQRSKKTPAHSMNKKYRIL